MRASAYPGLREWRKCLAEPCWTGSVAGCSSEMNRLRVASADVGMVKSRVRARVLVNKEEEEEEEIGGSSQREQGKARAFSADANDDRARDPISFHLTWQSTLQLHFIHTHVSFTLLPLLKCHLVH